MYLLCPHLQNFPDTQTRHRKICYEHSCLTDFSGEKWPDGGRCPGSEPKPVRVISLSDIQRKDILAKKKKKKLHGYPVGTRLLI